jgi:hypothetical protein
VVRHGTRDSADVWTLLRLGGNHRGSPIKKTFKCFYGHTDKSFLTVGAIPIVYRGAQELETTFFSRSTIKIPNLFPAPLEDQERTEPADGR